MKALSVVIRPDADLIEVPYESGKSRSRSFGSFLPQQLGVPFTGVLKGYLYNGRFCMLPYTDPLLDVLVSKSELFCCPHYQFEDYGSLRDFYLYFWPEVSSFFAPLNVEVWTLQHKYVFTRQEFSLFMEKVLT